MHPWLPGSFRPIQEGSIISVCLPDQDNESPINSMDFHRTADLLVTASDDDSIHVYNTSSGEFDKVKPKSL